MGWKRSVVMVLSLFVVACDSSSGDGECTVEQENEFVYDLLRDFYLYADRVPDSIDPGSYPSPEALLADLRVQPEDQFSSISNAQSYNRFQEGEFIGAGFLLVPDSEGRPTVGLVYNDSPAAAAGLQRGDRITEVNGVRDDAMGDADAFNAAFGPAEIGFRLDFKLIRSDDDAETSVTVFKDLVFIDSTHRSTVINSNVGQIGYLTYTNFFANSVGNLREVFGSFRDSGVVELILDLRYNGGGRVSTARDLASLVRSSEASEAFVNLAYNEQYQDLDTQFDLVSFAESLNLNRLVVITSPSTCSASELVINGLRPYMEVITVGSTTCGKPVGQNPQSFCGKVISAVNFELLNRDGQGEYFSGIPADCAAGDQLSEPFGSVDEEALATAVDFLENGACPIRTESVATVQKRFGDADERARSLVTRL